MEKDFRSTDALGPTPKQIEDFWLAVYEGFSQLGPDNHYEGNTWEEVAVNRLKKAVDNTTQG